MKVDRVELIKAIVGGIGVLIGLWAWCVVIITATGQ